MPSLIFQLVVCVLCAVVLSMLFLSTAALNQIGWAVFDGLALLYTGNNIIDLSRQIAEKLAS